MKKTRKLLSLLLVLVVVLTMAVITSCGEEGDSSGSLQASETIVPHALLAS